MKFLLAIFMVFYSASLFAQTAYEKEDSHFDPLPVSESGENNEYSDYSETDSSGSEWIDTERDSHLDDASTEDSEGGWESELF